jgi:hypothetical protein
MRGGTPWLSVRRIRCVARLRLRNARTRLGYRRVAARAGAFLRYLLAQAEPRPGAAARLRPASNSQFEREIGGALGHRADHREDAVAGPDEWTDGIGYKLALPPPRHERLADFRVLVIDAHPLSPTAANVTGALNRLVERLTMLGAAVVRKNDKLPGLALTSKIYRELLSAFCSADLPPEARQRVEVAAEALSPDDQTAAMLMIPAPRTAGIAGLLIISLAPLAGRGALFELYVCL